MRFRRPFQPPFKVGDYVQHKHDPDIHGSIVSMELEGRSTARYEVQLEDGSTKVGLGHWLLKKINPLEAIVRARKYRGPTA